MAYMTRALAFMHDEASAKKLNIAPAESSGDRNETPCVSARTLSGASILSSESL